MWAMWLVGCGLGEMAPPSVVWDWDTAAPPLTVYEIGGERYDDGLGKSVAVADVDGDGWAEVLVSAPYAIDGGHWAGKVYLFGSSMLRDQSELQIEEADASWLGGASRDLAGEAIALAPGVSHSGVDVVVGARYQDDAGTAAGMAYVVSTAVPPRVQGASLSGADWLLEGESSGDYAGTSVLGVGDVDGGGIGDVWVGAPGNDHIRSGGGRVYLLLGENLSEGGTVSLADADLAVSGTESALGLGAALADAGDLDGDGVTDVVAFGADDDEQGRLLLLMGADVTAGAALDQDFAQLAGQHADDRCGETVVGGADWSGDGIDDLAVACPGLDDGGVDAGAVLLLTGPSPSLSAPWLQLDGRAGQQAGMALGVGDIDGDARPDLMVGAPQDSVAWVVMGADTRSGTGELSASAWELQGTIDSSLGQALALGDVDGDGLSDLVVSAPDAKGGSGSLYVLLGAGLQRNGSLEL